MSNAGQIKFTAVVAMMRQKRGVIRRDGEKQRRAVTLDICVDVFRSRAVRREDAGRANGKRKISGVPEAVSEEQFGHTITAIMLVNTKNGFCVKFGAHHHVVMQMNAALWSRCASGGVEPECGIVFASGRRAVQFGRGSSDQLAKIDKSAGRRPNKYRLSQILKSVSWNLLPLREENFADDGDACMGVIQQILILVRLE